MYVATKDCFFASKKFVTGRRYKKDEVIPDCFVDPDNLPEFVAVVESAPELAKATPPVKMSLSELGDGITKGEDIENLPPERQFKRRIRPSDKPIV